MNVLAYHLTWTCYGQWLQGDARGYVDRTCRTPGTPYRHNEPRYYNASANRMEESPVWLSDPQRKAATAAVRSTCDFRRWALRAVNVQPDHAHVVVEAPGVTGKIVRRLLKGWATRSLKPGDPTRRRFWTKGGKVELIRDARRLAEVIDYVNHQPFPRVDA